MQSPPEHGNFRRYYTFRPGVNDRRLAQIPAKYFLGRSLLDVGCNSAEFTLMVARRYHPLFVEGIDIDGDLVLAAESRRGRVLEGVAAMRTVLPVTWGRWDAYFRDSIRFTQADVLEHRPKRAFGTVMCLSVSKWVHLNHGDEGLLRLFDALHSAIEPQGFLVFEYQRWQSYRNSRNVSLASRTSFDRIQVRPEEFIGLLVRRGWRVVERFNEEEEPDCRFTRPLLVLQKLPTSPPSRLFEATCDEGRPER